jgi:co-chaperonin GroES (HSP10)
MDHSKADPAETVRKAVGDISQIEITGVQILVGTYLRPAKTGGGIILTEKIRDEDIYQGKVGLVLKVAEGAFVDGPDAKFNGFTVKEGDWVFYRVADGFSMSINGHHCRLIEDVHIRGRVPSPDIVL